MGILHEDQYTFMIIFHLLLLRMKNVSDKDFREKHTIYISPLNAELNPICHLLALVGAHHIFHVSRVRVNKVFQK